jgi:hypothetical protein
MQWNVDNRLTGWLCQDYCNLMFLNVSFAYVFQGQLVWFDTGVGYPVPGEVVDFSRYHNYISIKTDLEDGVSILSYMYMMQMAMPKVESCIKCMTQIFASPCLLVCGGNSLQTHDVCAP